MPQFVKVGRVDDIPDGECQRVELEGRPIGLFSLDGQIFAIDDTCTHAEASLCEGEIIDDEVLCPLHFASFNIRTGACTGPPADDDVASHLVRVTNGDIEVAVRD